ncbi:hypothetical protein [Staphylococcus arlettae]|uniref:hypothetical protein n=2 Tax=Staphylococcus arlettae TaxID=29378 RepID=UPI000D19E4D2|nr:hypothetical protein [Staphylococcus arlettae]PTH21743.1 hypothetical protein BU605_13235 [Staphylococcus arlettae]PTH50380.1 hypothetical protein BU597_12560 [Staphylococcus arlettae]PUZ34153.1 hypothetical protein BU606_00905 [Staphylococcus arlettae]RIM56486.1 hypothetical protein BU598_12850 [Staphylococcus arlettae]
MNKTYKLYFLLTLLLGLTIILNAKAYASNENVSLLNKTDIQNVTMEEAKKIGDITYEDNEVLVISFNNNEEIANLISKSDNTVTQGSDNFYQSRTTVNGPAGVAKINSGNNGRSLYWMVRPRTAFPYLFSGKVNIKYYSDKKRVVNAIGTGAIGSSTSGVVYMKRNKGSYAKLSGTAKALNGRSYRVLPSVGTSF